MQHNDFDVAFVYRVYKRTRVKIVTVPVRTVDGQRNSWLLSYLETGVAHDSWDA